MIIRNVKIYVVLTAFVVSILALSDVAVAASVGETVTVFREKGVYAAFPDVFTTGEGDIAVSFAARGHASHYDSSGGMRTAVSKDGGKTWDLTTTPLIDPRFKTRSGAYVVPSAVGWKEIPDADAAVAEAKGIVVRKSVGKQFTATEVMVKRSTDGGKTWRVEKVATPPLAMVMSYNSSSFVVTSAGVRLMALYGKKTHKGMDSVYLLRSSDDGTTWTFFPMFPAGGPATEGFNETALAEADDGTLVALLRSDPDRNGDVHVSRSTDGGITWSTPASTGTYGYPANIMNLNLRGFCLVSYGYRKQPMGIRAKLFSPASLRFVSDAVVLRDDSVGFASDVGYPESIRLDNGNVLTVYYLTGDDRTTYIAGTIWRPESAFGVAKEAAPGKK